MDTITRLRSAYTVGRRLPQWTTCCTDTDSLLCYTYPLADGYELLEAITAVLPEATLADVVFMISNAALFEAAYGQLRKGMRILLCVRKPLLGTRGFIANEIVPDHYEITVMDWPHFFEFLAGLKTSLTMTIEQDTVVINALPTDSRPA